MSTQQLIKKGRGEIEGINQTLGRTERIVQDTLQVGREVGEGVAGSVGGWVGRGGRGSREGRAG